MTYDNELTLISEIYIQNEIGEMVPVESETTVLCKVKSVKQSEFYNAAATGLRPARIFVIHGYEYAGQQKVEFEGKRYSVLRMYATEFEEVELTCVRTAAADGAAMRLIDTELVQGLKGLVEEILADEDVAMDSEARDAYSARLAALLGVGG